MENHISSRCAGEVWRAELSEKSAPNGDNRSRGFSVLSRERAETRETDQGVGRMDTPGLRVRGNLNGRGALHEKARFTLEYLSLCYIHKHAT